MLDTTANGVPATQATGRHRRESSRPVGNSSNPKVGTRSPATAHGHPSSQPAHSTPGRCAPGASAASTYSCPPIATGRNSPLTSRSQPTGLRGRARAIDPPSTGTAT